MGKCRSDRLRSACQITLFARGRTTKRKLKVDFEIKKKIMKSLQDQKHGDCREMKRETAMCYLLELGEKPEKGQNLGWLCGCYLDRTGERW